MNLNLGSFVLLAIVFVTVGFIGGALIALYFSGRETNGDQTAEPAKPPREREQEIAVLLRDPENGSLIMEMQGRAFTVSKELPDKTRAALLRVAQEWFIWLGGRIESPKAAAAQAARAATSDEAADQEKLSGDTAQNVKAVAPVLNESKKVSVEAVPVGEPASKAASIVEQIDEILQDLLYRSPLANRKIRLAEDLKMGVVVWVDHKSFVGIDAVDEPEVSAIIRQAVAEWERRAETRR